MRRSEQRIRVTRVGTDSSSEQATLVREDRADVLAVEEPLEIRVNGRKLVVTMRTPSDDFSLAVGFLLSEGIISRADEVASVRYCNRDSGPGAENADNTVDVVLAPGVSGPDLVQERRYSVNSSCGICGRDSIEQVQTTSCYHVLNHPDDDFVLTESTVLGLPDVLRDSQKVFERTGAIHAAGLYNTVTGEMIAVREDVGRHNATDKVLGWALLQGLLPLRGYALVVSSRASFELAQKAMMAGIPMLVAVSAPTSLAVNLARDNGMTLCGFTRTTRCVIYAGAERVQPDHQQRPDSPDDHNSTHTAELEGVLR